MGENLYKVLPVLEQPQLKVEQLFYLKVAEPNFYVQRTNPYSDVHFYNEHDADDAST